MTSPLTVALDDITTNWEAATPPSVTKVTYHRIDDEDSPLGAAHDRGFTFEVTGSEVVGEAAGAAATQTRWSVTALVIVAGERMGRESTEEAIANEAGLLSRRVDLISSWSSANILEVFTRGLSDVTTLDTGDLLLGIDLEIVTSETDT